MTNSEELAWLIDRAKGAGAIVQVEHDAYLKKAEGRHVIDSIKISRLEGVGPGWMSAIYAAETLRRVLYQLNPVDQTPEQRLEYQALVWFLRKNLCLDVEAEFPELEWSDFANAKRELDLGMMASTVEKQLLENNRRRKKLSIH